MYMYTLNNEPDPANAFSFRLDLQVLTSHIC